MKTSTKEFYARFHNEIGIDVGTPIINDARTIDAVRESLKNIANAKYDVSGGQKMEIAWRIDGKYYKETVTT